MFFYLYSERLQVKFPGNPLRVASDGYISNLSKYVTMIVVRFLVSFDTWMKGNFPNVFPDGKHLKMFQVFASLNGNKCGHQNCNRKQ